MVNGLINENPIVYEIKHRRDVRADSSSNTNELSVDAIDHLEVFDILCKAYYVYRDHYFFEF